MIKVKNKLKYEMNKFYDSFIQKRKIKKIQSKIELLISKNPVVKLHIGCGPRILKGWINIDAIYQKHDNPNYTEQYFKDFYPKKIRGDKNDFILLDINKFGLPFKNNSVDIIFNEDFIEHLSQRNQIAFLNESLRVLKKGGVHRINTPNLLSSMREHSNFSEGIKRVYFKEWDGYGHINVLTPNTLNEMALIIGYSKIIFNKRDESTCKLIPREYRPGGARSSM